MSVIDIQINDQKNASIMYSVVDDKNSSLKSLTSFEDCPLT